MQAKRALLVLDMQVGLFHGPEQPWQGDRVLNKVNTLIGAAHAAQAPVFAVRHTGPQGSPIAAGSPAWQLLPALAVDPARDIVFDKTRPSAFFATSLADQLREAAIDELVIVGLKTQYCVDTNCRVARELGFNVVLVSDAHTCMDTPGLSAEAIIAHHNLTLGGAFARLQSTADVQF
ncbi:MULTISPECIES: cysteine hydrolase family protein [Pseudomonas]|uniref:Cysteine hydrolase n=1 Tax=Pseudomonas donghuensis TaxID=1163398 RepID=A0AAP0SH70_9PSED|nr:MULTISPECIES: cysteine hydrolase family protein [Pseudomonas]MDF9894372.1 nicotinamidase-related amidase [Pseudomonas vranovensis]KDN98418.2 cysteine hydrolase [Pseudomonas donghuensis]MCP3749092.1 cysteine hydrolase [Pseudomonas sp. SBB6]MCP6692269.1 cysteine hydrolase [Pseudomonas donghuensis]PJY96680.1 cysteine hydrolase [Pseudomonas donghuensis]